MIQIKQLNMGAAHTVTFSKEINGIPKGITKDVLILPMQGRIYNPGKDENGKFIDTIGVKDNRVQVMGVFDPNLGIMDLFYYVAKDMQDVHDCFEE